jgi:tRNA-dihydrouridine synthase
MVVKLRDEWQKNNPDKVAPLIFGNGDITDIHDANQKCIEFKADGAMIGRAMFGNPWLFKDIENIESGEKFVPTREERIKTLIKQVEIFNAELGDVKSFALMKKFFKTYMTGFDDAKDIREAIMGMESAGEVVAFLNKSLADTL